MNFLANIDLIVLFFILGIYASWIKSDLEVPEQIAKFLSVFLLLSLGLKGGHEVRIADHFTGFAPTFSIGLISCLVIPIALYFSLRARLGLADAAALAASYGSVSAVTFITAQGMLQNEGFGYSGFMVAIMALMEIPAILTAIFLYRRSSGGYRGGNLSLMKAILATKSVVLLLGGFFIGLLMNETSWAGIAPVVHGSFKGVLAFFLLDLGIAAQKKLRAAWGEKSIALPVAVFLPLAFGSLALLAGQQLQVPQGDAVLLAVLVGSASYIAAPAAIRTSIPAANPSLYLALPLALTFPLNVLLGIPLYIQLSRWLA